MAVVSLVNLAAQIAALGVVFALGVFLAPLLQVLARRLFARLGHPLVGFAPLLLVLFLPALALAQAAASSPPAAAPSPFVVFILQYLPWLLGVLLALFVSSQTGITGRLQAWRDAADATATTKALAGAALTLDHLAADFAGKLMHDLQANPGAKAADLLPLVSKEAKATLSEDGQQALSDGLGVVVSGLEARIGAAIAGKLQGVETHAAVTAGAQAVAAVSGLPLNQVAAQLVAKS